MTAFRSLQYNILMTEKKLSHKIMSSDDFCLNVLE